MPTYKNITVKKRGGGTRKQRVQVLASGKYKFVKNIVTRVKRRTTKRKSKPRRRRINLARRRKNRRNGKSLSRTIFKLARAGSLVAVPLKRGGDVWQQTHNPLETGSVVLGSYAGLNRNMDFDGALLGKVWTPYVVTTLITHLIPKLTGLIRRI